MSDSDLNGGQKLAGILGEMEGAQRRFVALITHLLQTSLSR
jgi:hypothetical protein